jgi:AraC family transcriptional regulator
MLQHLHITLSKPLILVGRNGTFKIGPSPGIKNLWTTFMNDFGQIEGQVGFKAYGVCHNFKGDNMDYMAAAEVSREGTVADHLFTLTVPERRVAIYGHRGGVDKLSEAWDRIFKSILPQANLNVAPGPQFELYDFSDPNDAGTIEIHIPVE